MPKSPAIYEYLCHLVIIEYQLNSDEIVVFPVDHLEEYVCMLYSWW